MYVHMICMYMIVLMDVHVCLFMYMRFVHLHVCVGMHVCVCIESLLKIFKNSRGRNIRGHTFD